MAETTKPEDKKTVIAFIVGLLIGGLLVWAFSGPAASAPRETEREEDEQAEEREDSAATENEAAEAAADESAPAALVIGEGSVTIGDKKAGMSVPLAGVTYPVEEGWIGIRNYTDGRLGYILGVVRFSQSQGLNPSEIILQTPTRAGADYAVVMYTEDGDRQFNLAADTQIDKVFGSFKAE